MKKGLKPDSIIGDVLKRVESTTKSQISKFYENTKVSTSILNVKFKVCGREWPNACVTRAA